MTTTDRPKKVRCTCLRCKKVNYLPATGIDATEPYLCQKCDDQFVAWQNGGGSGRTLAAFLARPQR